MLAHRQPIVASVRRDAWVEVDLNSVERNVAIIRSWLNPGTRLMGVVKSDAYGHGAPGLADVLTACGADWLGIASVDEGCQLRAAGVRVPVLLLSPCPSWAIPAALDSELTLTVTSPGQVDDIAGMCRRQNRIASVHLKIDSGMHRLGVSSSQLPIVLERLQSNREVRLSGVFTHFAKADEPDFTKLQASDFDVAIQTIRNANFSPGMVHMASGDAARRFPETHRDMVRVGLYLYGLEARTVSDVVHPAMSVRARINHIQHIASGESVGYNLTWTAERPTKIASIPVGYADGIDRGLSNRITGSLLGKRIPQIGLISMDQMLFDITDLPDVDEGDIVTLIGADETQYLSLADWAGLLDTITYELCCRLRARMPRVYTRQFQEAESGSGANSS